MNKGDKLRVFYQLEGLATNYRVHLVCIEKKSVEKEDIKAVEPFCASVNIFVHPLRKRIVQLSVSPFRQIPLQVAYFYSTEIRKKIERLIHEIKPEIVFAHTIRVAEYCRNIKGPVLTLDFMDAFGKGLERREHAESNPFRRILFRYEKTQLYRYETAAFDYFQRFAIITAQDKEAIVAPRGSEISVIPNGVDFSAFYPRDQDKAYDLVFMGNMSYPPNIDAVFFLCNEILPLIVREIPTVKLLIAGIGAPANVRALESDHVAVRSDFEHIGDSIASAKVMIAPMRLSTGLQNKILQAMAMEVPCVISRLSNRAVGAPHPQTVREGETAEEIAEQTISLLKDPEAANALARSASLFVKEHYSWEKQTERLIKLISGNSNQKSGQS